MNTYNLDLRKGKRNVSTVNIGWNTIEIFLWALPYKHSTFYNFSFGNFLIVRISIMEKIRKVHFQTLLKESKEYPLELSSILESCFWKLVISSRNRKKGSKFVHLPRNQCSFSKCNCFISLLHKTCQTSTLLQLPTPFRWQNFVMTCMPSCSVLFWKILLWGGSFLVSLFFNNKHATPTQELLELLEDKVACPELLEITKDWQPLKVLSSSERACCWFCGHYLHSSRHLVIQCYLKRFKRCYSCCFSGFYF